MPAAWGAGDNSRRGNRPDPAGCFLTTNDEPKGDDGDSQDQADVTLTTDPTSPFNPVPVADPPADEGWSFCKHRPVSTPPVRLVLFDVDGTLADHDGAVAAGAQQWLMAMGWADAGTIAGPVSAWDEIAERHFPAYRARLTTFQDQRRLRLREFLPVSGSTLPTARTIAWTSSSTLT
jgi:hypothetical protein